MAKKTKGPRRAKIKRAPKNCFFCEAGKSPSFEDLVSMQKFLTERGKIVGRARNGLCSKHQRDLAREIKYARHLALLPFVTR